MRSCTCTPFAASYGPTFTQVVDMTEPATPSAAALIAVASVTFGALLAAAIGDGAGTIGGVPIPWIAVMIAFVIQWLAFVPAYRARTEHFYDLVGSLTYLTVVWSCAVAAGVWDTRTMLLVVAISIWAARLGAFLFARVRARGHDGRFDHIKVSGPRFFVAWTLQGLWVFVTASAAIAAIASGESPPLGWLDAIGFLMWAVGFGVEVVADAQKSGFRRAHPGEFVDTGLWAWSRHPNYFGEILLWIGITIIASSTFEGWRWMALVSPAFVYVLLTRVSGIPPLAERAEQRWGKDPSFRAYLARTPRLVPRPPQREIG